jgi:hypothetical protein
MLLSNALKALAVLPERLNFVLPEYSSGDLAKGNHGSTAAFHLEMKELLNGRPTSTTGHISFECLFRFLHRRKVSKY